MASSIQDYVSEETYVTFNQLKNRFGEPIQIASTYVDEMEAHKLSKELKKKKRFFNSFIITMLVIITLWIGVVVTSFLDHKKNVNGYAIVEIIEIDNNVINEGEN